MISCSKPLAVASSGRSSRVRLRIQDGEQILTKTLVRLSLFLARPLTFRYLSWPLPFFRCFRSLNVNANGLDWLPFVSFGGVSVPENGIESLSADLVRWRVQLAGSFALAPNIYIYGRWCFTLFLRCD